MREDARHDGYMSHPLRLRRRYTEGLDRLSLSEETKHRPSARGSEMETKVLQ